MSTLASCHVCGLHPHRLRRKRAQVAPRAAGEHPTQFAVSVRDLAVDLGSRRILNGVSLDIAR